jgi:hypothetical protein
VAQCRVFVVFLWAVALLYVAPHWLVDPRYYVVPAVLLTLLLPLNLAQLRRLAAWYALLAVIAGIFVLRWFGLPAQLAP